VYTYIYTQVPLDDPNLMFEIFTDEGGFSNGRVYALRHSSPEVYRERERERRRIRRRRRRRRSQKGPHLCTWSQRGSGL
jgi:hypothetical protein